MKGQELVRAILNRRLTKCLSSGAHYPFERRPMKLIRELMLVAPQPPLPSNCARCGIGGAYRFYFDNAGRPMAAEVTYDL